MRYIYRLAFIAVLFFSGCFNTAYSAEKVLNEQTSEVSRSDNYDLINQACDLIYKGDFQAAGNLIDSLQGTKADISTELSEIILDYKAIEDSREAARQAAFEEKYAQVEKFKLPDANGLVADFNDVNDLARFFTVVATGEEYADQQQKKKLLSNENVKNAVQKAIDKAATLENDGKWLDSYLICYSWLQVIYADSETYDDHSESLVTKANIAASFQDSPCETAKQRYEGVNKEIFQRSVSALNAGYVNIIDYTEMAQKGIERCLLLSEVVERMPDSNDVVLREWNKPDSAEFLKFSAGLKLLNNETSRSLIGISREKFLDIFDRVLKLNDETLKLPDAIMIIHFAEASLAALDPYTVIIWPKRVEDFEKSMTNEFTGIGIEISKEKGLLTVSSLLPDTPAYYSGLDAEDIIEKVDGLETRDMSLPCAVKNITGPAGTDVVLSIRRPVTAQTFDVKITRDRILVSTIRGWQRTESGQWLYMIDEAAKIAYIRLTGFDERSSAEMESVLVDLENKGINGLILDLRYNPGGLLSTAGEIVDKFISSGLIVSTKPRYGFANYLSAHDKGSHRTFPLVLLINSSSASASEIVAGALADKVHERAILVGRRTHGKGSVQTITGYPGGGAQLKYTMAYYHLPSGQRVESAEAMKKLGREDWGVGPDVHVELRSDEFKKLFDVRRDNDVLVKAGHNSGDSKIKKHNAEQTLESDPQLAIALLIAKAKNLQREVTLLQMKN